MYDQFDETTHEAKFDRAIWHTSGSSGNVPVIIVAYSLGATRAFCILHIDRLEAGNYSATWLPVNKLTIEVPSNDRSNNDV